MSRTKTTCDVFVSSSRSDKQLSDQIEGLLRSYGLTTFADADIAAGAHFEDVIWEAMAESQAVVVVISKGEPSAWIAFELGAAKAWNKAIYAVAADPATARLPLGFGNVTIYPPSRIEEVAQQITQSTRPLKLTVDEVESLVRMYLSVGLPVDQLMLQPAKLQGLTARFNRLNRKKVTTEDVAHKLVIMRKRGELPRLSAKVQEQVLPGNESVG